MLRELGLVGASAALLVSSVFITGSGASTTIFNTSGATVTCNTLIAVATIAPPISSASTGTATITVKGTLGGCTSSGATVNGNPQEPTIVSGSVAGKLTTSGAAGCAGLLLPSTITGNMVAKWKVGVGQKLDFSSTTLSGGTITGGLFVGPSAVQYGQFTLSGQSVAASSAFAGGAPSTVAATSEDVGSLAGLCAGSPPGPGIKTIHLGLGRVVG